MNELIYQQFLAHFLEQGELFLRILIAGVCGIMIGFERKNRLKEAGIRTHLIVALGSALMMVVSKYGFEDVLFEGGRADASRIASQIVTGVGFLGAGTIFVRKQAISGLTTAAGIWATAGIGMAIGSGMYSVGIASALIIVFMQKLFHGKVRFLQAPSAEQIAIRVENTQGAIDEVCRLLEENEIKILNMKIEKLSEEYVNLDVFARFPIGVEKIAVAKILADEQKVKIIDL